MTHMNIGEFPVPICKVPSSPIARPKHQTNRSITEASFPKLHRPHHHHHHPHIHRHAKEAKGKEIQSAHPILQSNVWGSIDGIKSEGVTPSTSRNQSRRASILGVAGEMDGSVRDEKRVVREGELETEKGRGVLRATELRNALTNLNAVANNASARLDNAYWRVLEKVSELQRTIMAMKELAAMTKQLKESFKQESEDVVTEVEALMEGFKGFEDQEKRIGDLTAWVRAGREKIKTLGDRVEVVKERVDGWEKSEGEWKERTRKRLKVLWIVIGFCGAILLGIMVLQYTPARTQGPGVLKGLASEGFGVDVPNFEGMMNESWTLKREKTSVSEKLKEKTESQQRMDDDTRLRLFDEL